MGISETRSAIAIMAMLLAALPAQGAAAVKPGGDAPAGYAGLIMLFEQWREFEHPVMRGKVPDYGRPAMAAKAAALPAWRAKLDAIDTRGWPTAQLNDYKL